MGRIRTVKPDVAKHETLFELEQRTRLPIRFVWVMFPTVCDRDGRFKWRPRALKSDLLPFDALEFEAVLEALLEAGQIAKYRVGSDWFGVVPTFRKHQRIGPKEESSDIPAPDDADEMISRRPIAGIGSLEGKGKEGKGTEGNGSVIDALRARFDRFWLVYPRKVAKDAAWREWLKRSPDDELAERMIAAVTRHRASQQWTRDGGQFIPHARTWLHQGRWQDEDTPQKPAPARWSCLHVDRCANPDQCRQSTILERPVRKVAS